MRATHERTVMTGVMALAIAILVGSSLMLGPVARTAPLVVGVPTLLLLLWELAKDARPDRTARPAAASPTRGEITLLLWLATLVALIAIVGVIAAAAAWVCLFVRVHGRESWTSAVIYAGGLAAVLLAIFTLLLRFPVDAGSVIGWAG